MTVTTKMIIVVNLQVRVRTNSKVDTLYTCICISTQLYICIPVYTYTCVFMYIYICRYNVIHIQIGREGQGARGLQSAGPLHILNCEYVFSGLRASHLLAVVMLSGVQRYKPAHVKLLDSIDLVQFHGLFADRRKLQSTMQSVSLPVRAVVSRTTPIL